MKRKNIWIPAAVIAGNLLGLVITGRKIGWGPFSSLYSWDHEVSAITEKYPVGENQNGIVFYGASNFRLWKEMEQDLSTYRVGNHAFGGSTDKLLVKYADQLLYPYHPKIVFFQTGSNDYTSLTGSDEEKVRLCMDYKRQMFERFHAVLPDAEFIVMSGLLLPGRAKYTSLTQKINAELQQLCAEKDYMHFVDSEKMTYDGNNYRDDLFIKDGIHLNHDGQLLWRDLYIKPALDQIIQEKHLESVLK